MITIKLVITFSINDLIGGFYSDTEAFVGDSCLRCPNGTFVHYNKAPGVSARDCTACPQGRNVRQVFYATGPWIFHRIIERIRISRFLYANKNS